MIIRNSFCIPSGGDYEQFGIFNGTVVLDGPDSALDLQHRFLFGKNANGSDVILIGRRNGDSTTAPAGLSSKLKVSDGVIWMQGLIMGTSTDSDSSTAKPLLQVDDGKCSVGCEFYLASATGVVATVEVNGGIEGPQSDSDMACDANTVLRIPYVDEIQAMIGISDKYADLQVAAGAAFISQGDSNVEDLSGEGFVEGEITVNASIAPGGAESTATGAVLTVDTLNLASNCVYECTWSEDIADVVAVEELNIGGPCVVDLGLDSENPVPNGSFRTVLMYYDTIIGEANLDDWTITNAGLSLAGLHYDIFADDGEVVLTMENMRGTLMILR